VYLCVSNLHYVTSLGEQQGHACEGNQHHSAFV